MPQFYKILTASPLGNPWTPNMPDAKPIQNFWCQVEGEELAVSIGKQVPNVVTPGDSVYGDLVKAKSQKGTDYWKFKSVKVPEGTPRPATTPAQATAQQAIKPDMSATMPDWFMPIANQIDYIFREMRKMDADAATVPVETPAPEPAKAEPLSPEDTARVADIFNKPAAKKSKAPEAETPEESEGEPELVPPEDK